MSLAAVDVEAFEEAARKINDKLLSDEPLSPFDRGRFQILADKHPSSDISLQLRGMLCLADGDAEGFHSFFAKALRATDFPCVVHVNYAITLTYWGDHEGATKQIALVLKTPDEIVRTGCFQKCLFLADMLDDEEAMDSLMRMAEQYGLPAREAQGSVLFNLMGQLADDDPLLLSILDNTLETGNRDNHLFSEKRIARTEHLLVRCREAVTGVEADDD